MGDSEKYGWEERVNHCGCKVLGHDVTYLEFFFKLQVLQNNCHYNGCFPSESHCFI